jgi:hypothetical protein
MIAIIVSLATIMWYVIDNLKEKLWAGTKYSSYITIAVSALGSFALVFGYGLDIIFALGLVESVTVIGEVITALAMMAGSAVVSEIVELFRK